MHLRNSIGNLATTNSLHPKTPNLWLRGRKRNASKLTKTTEGTDEALGELVRQAGEARGGSSNI
jgi:hypothetical protein